MKTLGIERLAIVVGGALLCQGQSPLQTTKISDPFPGASVSYPVWANSLFVQWTHSTGPGEQPKIWAFDKTGKAVIPPMPIWFPGTTSARIHAAIAGPNHQIVASTVVWSGSAQMATLLCYLDPSGIVKSIRTNNFVAQHLAYSPDGVLWAFGIRAVPSPGTLTAISVDDTNTVRRYSPDGLQISEALPAVHLKDPSTKGIAPGSRTRTNGNSFLVATATGAYVYNSRTGRLAILNNQAALLQVGKFSLPTAASESTSRRRVESATATAKGTLCLDLNESDNIWELNPDTLGWNLISRAPSGLPPGRLLGIDGSQFVFASNNTSFGWFPAPAALR